MHNLSGMANKLCRGRKKVEESGEGVLNKFHLARVRKGGQGIPDRVKSLSHRTKKPKCVVCWQRSDLARVDCAKLIRTLNAPKSLGNNL